VKSAALLFFRRSAEANGKENGYCSNRPKADGLAS